MSTLFLINPGSGPKNNPAYISRIIRHIYQDVNEPCEVQIIRFETLKSDLAEAVGRGIRQVYAVGGDGTVNAVASQIVGTPLAFGVIPRGSGNGFARHLGYSTRLRLAVRQSLFARAVTIDVATWEGRIFVNVAGVGLDAEVSQSFASAGKRGFLPYASAAITRLLTFKAQPYTLVVDGRQTAYPALIGVVAANGTQWGYDASVSPPASIADGWLDLILVKPFPLYQAPAVMASLFMGTFHQWPFVERIQARTIDIHRQEPGPVHLDGEPGTGSATIQIRIVEHALQVLLPNTLRQERRKGL